MQLECYAAPEKETKLRGKVPENLRILDLTNSRIRPGSDHKHCVFFRKNERTMVIFETYLVIRDRIKRASEAGYEFASID